VRGLGAAGGGGGGDGEPFQWQGVEMTSPLQRMTCIANTHPRFDPAEKQCDTWSCEPAPPGLITPRHSRGPDLPCCMQPTSRVDALRLLNGSHVVFVGDSTARRGALQLKAFLEGSSFADSSQGHEHTTYQLSLPLGATVTLVTLCVMIVVCMCFYVL
jgi:hypothetical protein